MDPEGGVKEDSVNIHIAFFDLQNRSVRMLIVFLVIILLIGLSAFYRLGQGEEVSSEKASGAKRAAKQTTKKPRDV